MQLVVPDVRFGQVGGSDKGLNSVRGQLRTRSLEHFPVHSLVVFCPPTSSGPLLVLGDLNIGLKFIHHGPTRTGWIESAAWVKLKRYHMKLVEGGLPLPVLFERIFIALKLVVSGVQNWPASFSRYMRGRVDVSGFGVVLSFPARAFAHYFSTLFAQMFVLHGYN